MRVNELINQLKRLQAKHGNCDIAIDLDVKKGIVYRDNFKFWPIYVKFRKKINRIVIN